MKKKLFIIIGIILIVLLIFILIFLGQKRNLKYVSDIIGIDVSECIVLEEIDTHSGFLGDGEYFIKIDCSKKGVVDEFSDWKMLPFTESLDKVLQLNICDEEECLAIIDKYHLNDISTGYYYFFNRKTDVSDKHDESYLSDEYSFNFSLGVYEADTDIIYYYELDT